MNSHPAHDPDDAGKMGDAGDAGGPAIALQGSVWLSVGGATFGGAGLVALLAALAECGSA